MNIELLVIGVTSEIWLTEGMKLFAERLQHYIRFRIRELPVPKNISALPSAMLLQEEGKILRKALDGFDRIILLDEHGTEYSSVSFAGFLQKQMNAGVKNLAFVVGGAYGFDPAMRAKADWIITLSKMTFTHQMVRLIFTEQLYRAFTILKGESYHHE